MEQCQRVESNSGFTLVELMIVIAIIGVLASALFSMLTGYMGRSRDTARIAHLGQLTSTHMNYYTDIGVYPTPVGSGIPGCVNSGALSAYISSYPLDPDETTLTPPCVGNPGNYAYATGITNAGGDAFAIAARMEVSGAMIGIPITPSFTGSAFNLYSRRKQGDAANGYYVIAR